MAEDEEEGEACGDLEDRGDGDAQTDEEELLGHRARLSF